MMQNSAKNHSYQPLKPFSVEEYKNALSRAVSNKVRYRRILQVQYEAPGRTITATQLSAAVKYKNYNAANLHYGKIGRLLAKELGYKFPPNENGNDDCWTTLSKGIPATSNHDFQWVMHTELAQALEELGWVTHQSLMLPEEVPELEAKTYPEGAVKQITINAYERNNKARQKCIAHYGLNCYVCGFNFNKRYGEVGTDFIHIHHERPLSTIGEEYEVNPIKDLKPVCANCHAIIHRRNPAYTIDEVREMLC